MSRRFIKRPNIDRELAEIWFYIASDKIPPADRFLEVAAESFQRLTERPHIGRLLETTRRKLTGLRIYPMPSPYRNYLVIYQILPAEIEIIKVLQGMRDLEKRIDETI